MTPWRVEFVPPSRPGRLHWYFAAALYVVTAALAITAWHQSTELDRTLAAAEQAKRVATEMEAERAEAVGQILTNVAPFDADARLAVKQARLAVAGALTALESVAVTGVTPTAVTLTTESGQARMEVEFFDYSQLLRYVELLNEGEPSPRWELQQAQTAGPATIARQLDGGSVLVGRAVLLSSW